jgi:hypothetical protein
LAYPAASEESSIIPPDPRPVRDPDVITPFHRRVA